MRAIKENLVKKRLEMIAERIDGKKVDYEKIDCVKIESKSVGSVTGTTGPEALPGANSADVETNASGKPMKELQGEGEPIVQDHSDALNTNDAQHVIDTLSADLQEDFALTESGVPSEPQEKHLDDKGQCSERPGYDSAGTKTAMEDLVGVIEEPTELTDLARSACGDERESS